MRPLRNRRGRTVAGKLVAVWNCVPEKRVRKIRTQKSGARAVQRVGMDEGEGTYVLRLTGDDGEFLVSDVVTLTSTTSGGTAVVEVSIQASSDDTEERRSGTMHLSSGDLDLGKKAVSLRFGGVDVFQRATMSTGITTGKHSPRT